MPTKSLITKDMYVSGSILDISKQTGKSIAESFLNCDLIAIIDTSGSMDSNDSKDNQKRYDVAVSELAQLQRQHPGKIGVIAFSDTTIFCPNGIPQYLGGGTQLAQALHFSKRADVPGMKFVLISDGEPWDPEQALAFAKTFKAPISTIFVGPESDLNARAFLLRLANTSNGKSFTAECVNLLCEKIETLLLPQGS